MSAGQIPTRQVDGLVAALTSRGTGASWWPGPSPLVDYTPSGTAVTIDAGTGHQAFPTAVTSRSGKHLVEYRSGPQHAYDTAALSKLATSSNDGASWSTATLYDSTEDDGANGGLAQTRDSKVHAAIVIRNTSTRSAWYSLHRVSTDDGATWTGTDTITAGFTGETLVSDLIVLADGKTLLAALYGRDSGGTDDYAVVAASTDGGVTWGRRAVLASAAGQAWQEPRLVLNPDGEILAFLRYESGSTYRIYMARSVDDGTTWTTPVIILSAAGGLPSAHLTRNGLLVIAYREKVSGNERPAWAISRDRGNTWETRTNWTGTTRRYVYASWLDLSDGDLGCVYALETVVNGTDADLYFMRFARSVIDASPGSPAIESVTHHGAEGDIVKVVGGVLTTATPTTTSTGYREVLMASGVTPPEALASSDNTDWLYGGAT